MTTKTKKPPKAPKAPAWEVCKYRPIGVPPGLISSKCWGVTRDTPGGKLEHYVMPRTTLAEARKVARELNTAKTPQSVAAESARDAAVAAGAASAVVLVAMPAGQTQWLWQGDRAQCREMLTLNLSQLLGALSTAEVAP